MWWKKKDKPKLNEPWDLTAEEALEKYGSASKVLDALALEPFNIQHPILKLMLMERAEKLKNE